ncbi:SDR family NAD(P)-dependent oxidoreductase [Sphingobium xenophagum]|uniref:SDR family NAD(P)-dependent oxidoreductase n=1 Tax=Sphingobium xenophagum TaxID=121428 RepID=UPI00037B948B|nr:SDR family oxidoreductase [Sphingobium xenophagum]
MRLAGKRALITGGTSGMGRGVVTRFIDEGAQVVFCGRNVSAGRTVEDETGGRARFVRADVTQDADVRELVERAAELLGGIDCLFNNAAEAEYTPFLEVTSNMLRESMWSVFGSVVLVSQHVARLMIEQRGGVILQNGSTAAHRANSSPALYSALKAAVCHLTRCLAMEFAPYGIRVNAISPGAVVTPIFQTMFGLDHLDPEEALRRIAAVTSNLTPLGRGGTASDIASAAVYLASDEASYVTGHDLVVDGGLTAGLTPRLREAHLASIRQALSAFEGEAGD